MRITISCLVSLATIALLSSCAGRDEDPIQRPDFDATATDTDEMNDLADEDTSSSDTAVGEDTALADTSTADTGTVDTGTVDTAMPDTTPPQDTDPGPRELVNGTPVRFGHIIDGDTLDVFVGGASVKVYTVRLKGLSAPECYKDSVLTDMFGYRQQCTSDDEIHGLAAREGLVALLDGKEGYLTCDDVAVGEWCPTDNFNRYLAYIEVDGQDVSTRMAFDGHGLSYTSFSASKRADICLAEYDAQANNRGMWAGGGVNDIMDGMSPSTRSWYYDHHDSRCDAAIAAQ